MRAFYKKHKEIIDYLFFGVVTTVVSMAFYKLTTALLINYSSMHTESGEASALLVSIATAVQWVTGVVTAFITNRLFVFRDRNNRPGYVAKQFAVFAGSRVVTWFIDWGISVAGIALFYKYGIFTGELISSEGAFYSLINKIFSADFIVKCISAVIVVILNYIISVFIVFRRTRKENRERKEDEADASS